VDSWAALSAVNKVWQAFADLSRYVRVSWTLAGTGLDLSATFRVDGDAHQLYLQAGDITGTELPAKAISGVPKTVVANALIVASADGETAMASSFTLPIVSMKSVDMTQRLAAIAAFHVMKFRGFQPQGTDELIVDAKNDADTWLMRVSQAKIRPPGIVDSAPSTYEGGAAVVTNASRGW
jgi:phage gp36-like protein